jgi:hypothetical protein
MAPSVREWWWCCCCCGVAGWAREDGTLHVGGVRSWSATEGDGGCDDVGVGCLLDDGDDEVLGAVPRKRALGGWES